MNTQTGLTGLEHKHRRATAEERINLLKARQFQCAGPCIPIAPPPPLDSKLHYPPLLKSTYQPPIRALEPYDSQKLLTQDYINQNGVDIEFNYESDILNRYNCYNCDPEKKNRGVITRVFKSPHPDPRQRIAHYLCHNCVTDDPQFKGWTEITGRMKWVPPPKPDMQFGDVYAKSVPNEMKHRIGSNKVISDVYGNEGHGGEAPSSKKSRRNLSANPTDAPDE